MNEVSYPAEDVFFRLLPIIQKVDLSAWEASQKTHDVIRSRSMERGRPGGEEI